MLMLMNYLLYIGKLKKEKMKKKILFLAAILFIISCEPEPEDPELYYTIKNVSTHNLKLTVFDLFVQESNYYCDTTFLLIENSEIVFRYKYLSSIDGAFGPAADSTYIIFDDIKQLIYKRGDGKNRNIFDIENYIERKIDYNFQFTYLISDEDYENAVEIK